MPTSPAMRRSSASIPSTRAGSSPRTTRSGAARGTAPSRSRCARRAPRRAQPGHPLPRRIMHIHVTAEARRLCFARHYLMELVPRLGRARRAALAVGAPVVLSVMAQLMMRPSPAIIRAYRIPRQVIDEVYVRNPRHRADTLEALDKVRTLASELGLITPRTRRLWQALGIWAGHPSS